MKDDDKPQSGEDDRAFLRRKRPKAKTKPVMPPDAECLAIGKKFVEAAMLEKAWDARPPDPDRDEGSQQALQDARDSIKEMLGDLGLTIPEFAGCSG